MKGMSTIKTRSFNMLRRGALARGISLPAFATALALGGGLLLAPVGARAGTCVQQGTSGNFVCSGGASATDVMQSASDSIADSPLVVTTTAGFGLTVHGVETGLAISGVRFDGTTFIDSNASVISGDFVGIYVGNSFGALSLTSTGTATATRYTGIAAINRGTSTSLTLSANDSSGGNGGISAFNYGTGATVISSSGTATGGLYGIFGANDPSATDLTVTANNTNGGLRGIVAGNSGAGALLITSTGTATGGLIGIDADNFGTDLTITANDTTAGSFMGGEAAIDAFNGGTGVLLINSTGTASGTGPSGYGIHATNHGTNLTISANNTTGIIADNYGTGALSLTSTGTAIGVNFFGIDATNFGTNLTITANNTTGGITGILAFNRGTGATLVTSTGTATGSRYGIIGSNAPGATDLTINANNTTSGYVGISAGNGSGALSVTSAGTAMGMSGFGIIATNYGTNLTITANNATGGIAGISAINYGTGALSVTSTGTVTGGDFGVFADNDGTGALSVTASGVVTGGTGAGIATQSVAGGAVSINLASTAIVGTSASGSGVAILDAGAGNAVVTINRATVNGSILLGDGNDTLTIASGTSLAGVTMLSGDSGALPLPPPGDDDDALKTATGAQQAMGALPSLTASVGTFTDTLNLNTGFGGNLNDFETIRLDTSGGGFTLGGVISNANSLTKNGAGALTLTGISTFTGPTTVTGGSLNVTGMIASSPVTLQTGASLMGTGTVGAVMAQSGSTVSPGSAPGAVGTLSVNGNLTLAAGSTLAVDITPTMQDLVMVSGAATLGGNLVITPSAAMGFGQSLNILSATSVTGSFATTTIGGAFGSAFLPQVVINGASVALRLAPNSLAMLGGVGLGPNARAVATAIDAAVTGGFNPQAFMGLFTQGANLPTTLNQFTGEIHSAERRVALEDTRVVREAVFDRLGGGFSAPAGSQSATKEDGERTMTLWTQGVASTSKAQADGVGRRFTSDRTGFLFGGDIAINGFTFGGLFSYTSSDGDLARLDTSKVRSLGGAIYAGYRQAGGGFAVGAGAAVADTRFKGRRSITVPGVVQSLASRSGGTTYQIFGEVSYDLAKSDTARIEPFVRAAYARIDAGGLTETGGVAAVRAGKQGNDLTTTTAGLRGAYAIGKATLSGSAAYQRTSGDRSAPTDLSIVGVTNPFRVRSVALDRSAAALEAQASFRLAPRVTLGIGYSGVIGSNNTDHGGRGTLTFAW